MRRLGEIFIFGMTGDGNILKNLFKEELYFVKLSPQKTKAGRTEGTFFTFGPVNTESLSETKLGIGAITEEMKPKLCFFRIEIFRANNYPALRALGHNLKIAFSSFLQKFFGRHGRNGERSFPVTTQTTENHKLTPFEALTKRQYRRMSLKQISQATGIPYQKLREEARKIFSLQKRRVA